MLTAAQIRWAEQHDWFVADNGDGTIEVAERYSDPALDTMLTWRGGFAELREWAGY